MDIEKRLSLLEMQNKALFNEFVEHKKQTRETIRDLKKKILKKHEIEKIVYDKNEADRRAMQDLRDSAIKHLKALTDGD